MLLVLLRTVMAARERENQRHHRTIEAWDRRRLHDGIGPYMSARKQWGHSQENRGRTSEKKSAEIHQCLGIDARRSLEAIFTKLGTESAFIFCIILPRCAFTVISLIPSSPPICLFGRPETTNASTSRSR
jgi:hypothetical protein